MNHRRLTARSPHHRKAPPPRTRSSAQLSPLSSWKTATIDVAGMQPINPSADKRMRPPRSAPRRACDTRCVPRGAWETPARSEGRGEGRGAGLKIKVCSRPLRRPTCGRSTTGARCRREPGRRAARWQHERQQLTPRRYPARVVASPRRVGRAGASLRTNSWFLSDFKRAPHNTCSLQPISARAQRRAQAVATHELLCTPVQDLTEKCHFRIF